ncbi:hypothetical protein AOQ84DRAFT_305745 [Glonium stellatum]|uniref:Uncharacterized protein n=1 Tax=Glonium stellatum TaxID=574774 RepID=A0A8E2JM97_9PEZI|nr:hypothetical protein AOQ84DRAFT_305745 [Glonium stellatum]
MQRRVLLERLRIPSISNCVRRISLWRHISTSTSTDKSDSPGPTLQDAHRTLRVRKGNGRPLPIPPIIDPIVISERNRWTEKKPQPKQDELTPFQQKLYQNPYAHALTTPVRLCPVTHTRLPSAFLLSLHIKLHPETSDPWLVPVTLTPNASNSHGLPARFIARRPLVSFLGRRNNWRRTLSLRLYDKLGTSLKSIVWREDMPDLIQTLLQQQVYRKLRWHFGQPGGKLERCASAHSADLDPLNDVACVLYLRTLRTRADELQAEVQKIVLEVEDMVDQLAKLQKKNYSPAIEAMIRSPPHWWRGPLLPRLQTNLRFPPLAFHTAEYRGRRVAVYGLYDLLDEERVRELVTGTSFEGADCVVLKESRMIVPVQMALMQLEGYAAESGP